MPEVKQSSKSGRHRMARNSPVFSMPMYMYKLKNAEGIWVRIMIRPTDQPSAGMRAELEALLPPSPFNRFFKAE